MARDSSGSKNQPQYSATGVSSQAADLTEVSNYAAANGNRKAGTSTQRLALTGSDIWDGLEFYETDTGATWLYKATSWVRRQSVPLGTQTTSGQVLLTGTPTWVDILTVTATTSGGTCTVDWYAVYANANSGSNRTLDFQIVCDGVLVGPLLSYDSPLTPGSIGYGAGFSVSSALAAGSHTWKLQGRASAATSCYAKFATLKVTEV